MTASEIVAEFDSALAELVDLVAPATLEQWRMAGKNNPEVTRGEDASVPTDADNAEHADANPDPDRDETLPWLEGNAAAYRDFVRGPYETLQATGTWFSGPRTLDTLLGGVVPFHIRRHAGSIRATWAQNQG